MSFDVFLCHNSKDKPAVRALGERLRVAGFRPWLDEWELEAGKRFRKELEAQLVKIPVAAVLVGRDGMGPWQDLEIDVLLSEMVGRGCRVIPVLLESCPSAPEFPPFLRAVVWVDFRETNPDPFAKLIRGIRAALPAGKMPVNNLPASLGDLFTGREDLLAELEQNLGQPGATALVPAQTVSGLGGVGKTRLAIELAHRHAGEYTGIFFVNADSPSELRRNLAALAGRLLLNLNLPETLPEDRVVEEVKLALRERPGWLLILDNVDSHEAQKAVASVLPLAGGHVLITSRLQQWSPAFKQLKVHQLDPQSALDYLLKVTVNQPRGKGDYAAAAQLAEKLDHLPLALELTAAYIRENDISISRLAARWKQEEENLLSWFEPSATEYPRSLAATFARTFEKLNGDGQALLNLLSQLAPEPIPVALLEADSGLLTDAMGGREFSLKEAVAELQRYSLINRQVAGREKIITLHRLVQAVTRRRIPGEEKAVWVVRALRLVLAFAPEDPADVRGWPVWDLLRPHAARVLELAEEVGTPQPASNLMNELGLLLKAKALYHEAEPLMRRALMIDEKLFGPDHPKVATALNNLAQLLHDTNRLAEAEPMMRRALTIDEMVFGSVHPNVAARLNNLAQLLQDTNRLPEAEPLMRRALAIDESSFGPDHPNVAIHLNNLATMLLATNRLAEAEPLMRRALAIEEASFGPDHPNVALRLNNLAQLLQATNRLAEAEPLMRRALAIDNASLGPNHPKVAIRLNNLAQLFQDTNRLAEAEPLLQRALAIDQAIWGPNHPQVALVRYNLAQLQHKQGSGRPEPKESDHSPALDALVDRIFELLLTRQLEPAFVLDLDPKKLKAAASLVQNEQRRSGKFPLANPLWRAWIKRNRQQELLRLLEEDKVP